MSTAFSVFFTFQSGSIQIEKSVTKSTSPVIFTFQSGSIQIIDGAKGLASFVTFTFQSGSIQMGFNKPLTSFLIKLYIPIWFYSNMSRTRIN